MKFRVLALVAFLASCRDHDDSWFVLNTQVIVLVSGTTGLPFSGTLSEIFIQPGAGGTTTRSTSKRISGTVPATYSIMVRPFLRAVSGVIQKETREGELALTIIHHQSKAASGKTEAPLGVASVTLSWD